MKKVCYKCKIEKPVEEFHRSSSLKGGRGSYCKTCKKKEYKIYKKEIREQSYIPPPGTIKTCHKCKRRKPIDAFSKSSCHRDRRDIICRTCYKKRRRTYPLHSPATGTIKICRRCKIKKPIEEYNKNSSCKDGRLNICKKCEKKYHKKMGKVNRENLSKIPLQRRPIVKKCSRCRKTKPIKYFYPSSRTKDGIECCCIVCDKKTGREFRQKIKNCAPTTGTIKTCHKCKQEKPIEEFRPARTNRDGRDNNCKICARKYTRNYEKHRNKIDPEFKIRSALRKRIIGALKNQGSTKSNRTTELIGCSIHHLVKHIESQFDDKMTWDNYGHKGWHIDHIKPCAAFDLTKLEEQKKCFNYKNLQPLWEPDNLKKYSWYKGKLYHCKKHLTSTEIVV